MNTGGAVFCAALWSLFSHNHTINTFPQNAIEEPKKIKKYDDEFTRGLNDRLCKTAAKTSSITMPPKVYVP